MADLGQCWGTPNGQDLSSPSYWATGFQCVAEAILRRWTTSPGELVDDPDCGFNLSDLISDDLSPMDIARASQRAAVEAQKDERVSSAVCTLTFLDGVVTVSASIGTGSGPFRMVASVSAASTQLVSVSP